MILKYEVEIDLTDSMFTADAHPFCNFKKGDWEEYINANLTTKLLDLERDCGAICLLKNEKGEEIY